MQSVDLKTIKSLENRVHLLESEVTMLSKNLGVRASHKDPGAWNRLDALGKEISAKWKSSKPSWKLISESRR
jgi:hypothetical protein